MNKRLTFISTFTGIGGFDIGFENAGMECVGQCEIDRWANMVLRYHWPETKRINDVKKLTRSSFDVRPNIICGGFPCQDLSVAGKRAGLAGGRSGLFFEFERIVTEFKPDGFILENVPGLLSSNEKRDFATVLRRLGQCGYLQAYRVLDSQYFGVAQRRRRVFIVGSLGTGRCAEILFESESLPRNPAEGRKTGERIAATISQRSQGRGYGDDELNGNMVADVAGPIAPNAGPNSHDAGNFHCNQGVDSGHIIPVTATGFRESGQGYWMPGTGPLRAEEGGLASNLALVPETTRTLSARNDGSPCIDRGPEVVCIPINTQLGLRGADTSNTSREGVGVGNNGDPGFTLQAGHGHAVCFQQNTRDEVRLQNGDGDLAGCLGAEPGMKQQNYVCAFTERTRKEGRNLETQDELAYALTNPGSGGRPHSKSIAGPFGVRRLTPRECERLQGFKDDWTRWGIDENGNKVEISDTQRYKMCGNAVTVSVAEWMGNRI